MSAGPQHKQYNLTDQVDFLIVGCGASGSVPARELSRNGFSVVVLEQGPWLDRKQNLAIIPGHLPDGRRCEDVGGGFRSPHT